MSWDDEAINGSMGNDDAVLMDSWDAEIGDDEPVMQSWDAEEEEKKPAPKPKKNNQKRLKRERILR